jgi:hypothetical protein
MPTQPHGCSQIQSQHPPSHQPHTTNNDQLTQATTAAAPTQGLALLLRHLGPYGEEALYPLACDGDHDPDTTTTSSSSSSSSSSKSNKNKKKQKQKIFVPRRRRRQPALPPHLMRQGLWGPGEEERPVHRLRLLEPGAAHQEHRRSSRRRRREHEGEHEEEEEELTARPFFSPFQHWTNPHVAAPSFVLDLATPAGGALFLRPLEEVRTRGGSRVDSAGRLTDLIG